MRASRPSARTFDVPCTIEIEQTSEHFHAHVTLDGGIEIEPGDSVCVQGDPLHVAFGERRIERRTATVRRAGVLTRIWIKACARFQMHELYEVSFTPGRAL